MGGFEFVCWRMMLNTRSSETGQRLLTRVADALGAALEGPSIEPYWKDPTVSHAQFRTALGAMSPADAVFGMLTQAGRVSHGWRTSGPQKYQDDRWEFEALSDGGFTVSGVNWILCRTANF